MTNISPAISLVDAGSRTPHLNTLIMNRLNDSSGLDSKVIENITFTVGAIISDTNIHRDFLIFANHFALGKQGFYQLTDEIVDVITHAGYNKLSSFEAKQEFIEGVLYHDGTELSEDNVTRLIYLLDSGYSTSFTNKQKHHFVCEIMKLLPVPYLDYPELQWDIVNTYVRLGDYDLALDFISNINKGAGDLDSLREYVLKRQTESSI